MAEFARIQLADPDRTISIRDRLTPEVVFAPRWLFRCKIKILVVTDSSSGGFSTTAGFHLGQALAVVNDDPWSHVQFEFSKAHRDGSGESGVMDNFRFDQHNLSQYSQIWLFGIHREGSGTALSQAELRDISRFMDAGCGVFATGDHEDLGNTLCAQIPRVRNMRRWWHPNPGPDGQPVAPDQSGVDRLDTLVGGGTQTDANPQRIRPRYYQRTLIGGPIISQVARYPHPVLCGPNGVLDYLPDHMHEGLCEVPSDLSGDLTFDGETFEEYPDSGSTRPEVIAWATNNVNSTEFGVLAAYDGHRVDRGRVLVDATWHHWFNINTTPYENASNPTHPSYTPATVAKWEEIKDYYRNVALWLARPTLQNCIRNGGWIWVLGDYDILITHKSLKRVKNLSLYYWQLGIFARDALGRFASQCQSVRWIIRTLYPRPVFELENPFSQRPDKPRDPQFSAEMETIALGAAIHGALDAFRDVDQPERLLEDDGASVEKVMREGAKQGFEAFLASEKELCETLEKRLESALR